METKRGPKRGEKKMTTKQTNTICKPCKPKIDEKTDEKVDTSGIPRYRVLVHNDPVTELFYVIRTISTVFHYKFEESYRITMEAHRGGEHGVGDCGVFPLELAELHRDQLHSCKLGASIEKI